MSLYSTIVNPDICKYIIGMSPAEPEILKRIRDENTSDPEAHMQISPEQAQFLTCLIRILNPNLVLELGTFFGYSTLAMAFGLKDEGKVIACEINEEYAAKAIAYFADAGMKDKIDTRVAPGLDTIEKLLKDGYENKFDFIFIDADKGNYYAYYELGLKLVRTGGVIAIDNVLWYGRILDPTDNSKITKTINDFNRALSIDERIFLSIVPIGDGMTLAIKK